MNNETLLDTLDPEVAGALVSRREAIRKGAAVSSLAAASVALGSIPLALGALATEAGAQGTASDVLAVLKFAYLLENLEAEFYKTVLGACTGFSATNNPQAAALTVRSRSATFSMNRPRSIRPSTWLALEIVCPLRSSRRP